MYTASLTQKTLTDGSFSVEVTFTDGAESFTETVKPQSIDNLKTWVQNRITTLNDAKTLFTTPALDASIVEPKAPLTTAEEDREKWLKKYAKWVKIKTTLIDTGILTGTETKLVDLKTAVQTDYKPAYLDYID